MDTGLLDDSSSCVSAGVSSSLSAVPACESSAVPRVVYLTGVTTKCSDIGLIEVLINKLSRRGYSVIFPKVKEGSVVFNTKAIDESAVVLVVIFGNSPIQSEELFLEIGYAIGRNKPIVTLCDISRTREGVQPRCGYESRSRTQILLLEMLSQSVISFPLTINALDDNIESVINALTPTSDTHR